MHYVLHDMVHMIGDSLRPENSLVPKTEGDWRGHVGFGDVLFEGDVTDSMKKLRFEKERLIAKRNLKNTTVDDMYKNTLVIRRKYDIKALILAAMVLVYLGPTIMNQPRFIWEDGGRSSGPSTIIRSGLE